jgi:hypothetical protein
MDNLLDKLRAGDLDAGNRRRGNRTNKRRDGNKLPRAESVTKLAEDLLKDIQNEGQTSLKTIHDSKSDKLEPSAVALKMTSG